MVVTTGEFIRDTYQYAYQMMEVSRYYMILLQKDDIEAVKLSYLILYSLCQVWLNLPKL